MLLDTNDKELIVVKGPTKSADDKVSDFMTENPI